MNQVKDQMQGLCVQMAHGNHHPSSCRRIPVSKRNKIQLAISMYVQQALDSNHIIINKENMQFNIQDNIMSLVLVIIIINALSEDKAYI